LVTSCRTHDAQLMTFPCLLSCACTANRSERENNNYETRKGGGGRAGRRGGGDGEGEGGSRARRHAAYLSHSPGVGVAKGTDETAVVNRARPPPVAV